MKISIAQKHRLFSHRPGSLCLLPASCWSLQAFPTLIRLKNRHTYGSSEQIEIPLALSGPVKQFTMEQDLEKKAVCVWGIAKEGYYRLRFCVFSTQISLFVERAPSQGIRYEEGRIYAKDEIKWIVSTPAIQQSKPLERISFGIHRALDVDLVWRRFDLQEILPPLFHLGQLIPYIPLDPFSGTARLLNSARTRENFIAFLRSSFSEGFIPRLFDTDYQGFLRETQPIPLHSSEMGLFLEVRQWVRGLLFEETSEEISFLPGLFPEFHAGRALHFAIRGGDVDFEWSKKTLRRVIFRMSETRSLQVNLPKGLHSFRLRTSPRARGIRMKKAEALILEENQTYFLDQFQK